LNSILKNKPSNQAILLFLGFILCYVLWITTVVGWRGDHYYFVTVWVALFFATPNTRRMFFAFLYIVLYWVVYDSMRVFPNYLFAEVNILQPYEIEKSFFGVDFNGVRVTLNEYWQQNTTPFLNVITALFYLSWVPVPFAYSIYLWFKKERSILIGFTISFLLVNTLGWIIYYLYPAAPPWYYAIHGDQFIAETIGSPAGLVRFDQMFDTLLFTNMYTKSSSVFAAVPSLHAAFPLILTHFSLKRKNPILTLLFIIVLIGIWFSAVYTNHHYVIDLILGVLCGILTILIYEFVINKSLKKYLIDPLMRMSKDNNNA